MLGRSHPLSGGPRVRLRLARGRDAPAVSRLLELDPDSLEVGRLVRFDPRRSVVICATALLDSTERVVGLGAIDLDAGRPHVLVIAEGIDERLADLLRNALNTYVDTISRRVA